MRQVDGSVVLVAVLGVAALVLTGVAVAQSDSWTGERTYRFTPISIALEPQGPVPAGAAPARFEWPAPINATSAHLNVTVSFDGQAVQGGSAVVRVTVVAPDGRWLPSVTRGLVIGAGATSASLVIDHEAVWAAIPETVRDSKTPVGLPWTQPLVVLVSVDRPADLPVASYTFSAAVVASVTTIFV